ncbi:hypothetical protein IQ266_14570 [filamentous cyanobacterium LEGE 11480]|uniref:Uncharacterized protein n=1 Tax=Romeriopsis navalis LEGE 11480 TaxID=2777977 RepID=A0A928VLT1_9CYAN|nr:HHL1-like protein [Romeriopsis navalis]MBE9030958.1 hypothetical protein [Romeriopsis navalis LEGE 11480]
MTNPVGFGKPKQPAKPPVSAGAKKRAAAANEYDEMKSSGMPEYDIYLRVTGQKQWMPVGKIAVKRSTQIHDAIYSNEEALLQGAYHRMPVLKKNRANLSFEYGYRLKGFKDESIELAVRPERKIGNAIQNVVDNVGATISGLFQKKSK